MLFFDNILNVCCYFTILCPEWLSMDNSEKCLYAYVGALFHEFCLLCYLQFENFESLLFMFTTLFEIFYERKLGENSIQFQNINNNIYESLFKFFLS